VARRENSAKLKLTVGRRVAEIRRERGWTQERMAERLDCSVQWLSRIEGGGENMTLDTLASLANTLGVTAIDLLTPGEEEPRRRPRTKGRPKKTAT
jgi:transcriptional regulator with XRE-family HTH domain